MTKIGDNVRSRPRSLTAEIHRVGEGQACGVDAGAGEGVIDLERGDLVKPTGGRGDRREAGHVEGLGERALAGRDTDDDRSQEGRYLSSSKGVTSARRRPLGTFVPRNHSTR
jgi:hypothetical protein